MFVRKGQALGSVNFREFAELKAARRKKSTKPPEEAPQPEAPVSEPAPVVKVDEPKKVESKPGG